MTPSQGGKSNDSNYLYKSVELSGEHFQREILTRITSGTVIKIIQKGTRG